MTRAPDILCIGSVLWDVIGRADRPMQLGSDVPGHIRQEPGGVAMNVAVALRRLGLTPALLTALGRDPEATALIEACETLGLNTAFIHQDAALRTDRYMAVEDRGTLIGAIADAHSLEAAGDAILAPLFDGRLGSADAPYPGTIVLDGNLTADLLAEIAGHPAFAAADLRVVPASPGKAERLGPFLAHPRATLYLNLTEASLLAGRDFAGSAQAAAALISSGAAAVCVTDGASAATHAANGELCSAQPQKVTVARITGAGDCFMAAHIVAERNGMTPEAALSQALRAAAHHVSGGTVIP
ncbi:MAG: PfkB family carbohydrate kinase [Paracoccaceae bacterium]